jgi:hypothetical protein
MARPRFHVDPGDVPAPVAARRMGMTEAAFSSALPDLMRRGFPAPDPTTANFDLQAIDSWRRQRHAELFLDASAARPGSVARARLEARRHG